MAWYALVRDSDGELVSIGTVLANPLPAGIVALALPGEPSYSTTIWDAGTRTFITRPLPPPMSDRADDVIADSDLAVLLTNDTRRQQLRTVLERHFPAKARLYRPGEPD